MPDIEDPEVRVLADLSSGLEGRYAETGADPWAGSPFAWILVTPPRQRGAIGEQLVAGLCAAKGMSVVRSGDSDADRVINGLRFEIKFSTLWRSGGYKFQQIRNQAYDYLFCLGVSPFTAHAWVIPKPILFDYVIGHTGQHTGATGRDTAWIGFPASRPYPWMEPYGGTLSTALMVLQELDPGHHQS